MLYGYDPTILLQYGVSQVVLAFIFLFVVKGRYLVNVYFCYAVLLLRLGEGVR